MKINICIELMSRRENKPEELYYITHSTKIIEVEPEIDISNYTNEQLADVIFEYASIYNPHISSAIINTIISSDELKKSRDFLVVITVSCDEGTLMKYSTIVGYEESDKYKLITDLKKLKILRLRKEMIS